MLSYAMNTVSMASHRTSSEKIAEVVLFILTLCIRIMSLYSNDYSVPRSLRRITLVGYERFFFSVLVPRIDK